jgi:cobalamin biosynthesis Mg chelatase CobN
MKTPRIPLALSLAAIAALFATPVGANAAEEAVVPPTNSAAAQYTEAFPTSGGDKKTEATAHHRSPDKVLGARKTKKLEAQGPEGRAAAETAAATAPTAISATPAAQSPSTPSSGNSRGGGTGGGSAGQRDNAANLPQQGSGTATKAPTPEPDGSSGVGSALGQATGLSAASASGPLLPLAILATAIWALAYRWRQRRQVD